MTALRPLKSMQGQTSEAAAYAARRECDRYGRTTQQQTNELAALVECYGQQTYGGSPYKYKELKRAVWKQAKRMGIVPSGLLMIVVRLILGAILRRLIEHWLYRGRQW